MKIRNILQFFADPNTQTTGTSSLSAENKTFYEKELIEEASPELVHDSLEMIIQFLKMVVNRLSSESMTL